MKVDTLETFITESFFSGLFFFTIIIEYMCSWIKENKKVTLC